MKNLKMELFNFKQKLVFEQEEISSIVESFLLNYDMFSEKELQKALTERLLPYTYDTDVKGLLETVDQELQAYSLMYELKDLYKRLEKNNLGELYRHPLSVILEITQLADDQSRLEAILNELKIYEWVPEIKKFIWGLTKSPLDKQNMVSPGKAEKIYTIVEKLENGHLAFMADRWFLIDDKGIKQVLMEDYVKEEDRVRELRIMEQALTLGEVTKGKFSIRIDENIVLSLSTKNDKNLYINEEKLDPETTLESIFSSPIIPWLKKDYFMITNTVKENIDKILELDIALKIHNILQPTLECYVFNYQDKMYLYSKDTRTGSGFYEYESVTELINDIRKDLDFDVTHFFENKLSKELKKIKTLEDKEKVIESKIKDATNAIDELKYENELLESDSNLKLLFNNLLTHRQNLYVELNQLKDEKTQFKKSLVR
jgi:hypothetical protein